ncbi:MAG: UPF0236 family protein [Peptostreptococcus sp.]|uniref:UPF0236 family transposase-like protein n=1 Tax=Peptostreptococcus TaxID=1257 RepID=UPI00290D81E3|nr:MULTISPECIES: UPF0236 family protein [Peptostreptococcus]MDU3422354.1 UPF0236 family protein [Peptostreptococcus anaerobius]MDU3429238.1 UPF0236 family protein [Peptostreptococcus sp.]MDU3455379.1 UPF0236 family protein [Peptostreptococcus sp.]MDU5680378.1 UPF0236 family protein [Peptostreptococcus sp.]MDU5737438.1 UPF0236 family protein [Peptostreptococcus sp.]
MESIIQQICSELIEKILKTLKESDNLHISSIMPVVLEDCKAASLEITKEYIKDVNIKMRKNKKDRRTRGLVVKEKDINRKVITCLGELEYSRDLYFNKLENTYVKPIDCIFGIDPYERICKHVKAELVDKATEFSYEKSKKLVGVVSISRQSVRNAILKANFEGEKGILDTEKRSVKQLHVYADEDHVHLQKPNKVKGKASQIVPLVTVTEGTENIYRSRRKTKNPHHLVDGEFDTKKLWDRVDKYIQTNYDVDKIEKIYIHADGGRWIKNGLENYPYKVFATDGFHIKKYFKTIKGAKNPVCVKKIEYLIKSNQKDEAIIYMRDLCNTVEEIAVRNRCCEACN